MLWMALMAVMLGDAQTARPEPLPYEETVRCAGLTQAASELEGGESAEGRALSDAALYWSLTAAQAGVSVGRTATMAEADQTRARIRAVRELTANDEAARANLQRCRARTPHLG
ncbi:hypothetical protein ACIQC9_00950 [Brevundimonas sp. NPDC092305]|uniref:hypothetical protein n=1 Tax=Brevundimonas sp. NPDC092305 TaxID=3363957 RepID=UPI0037F4C048